MMLLFSARTGKKDKFRVSAFRKLNITAAISRLFFFTYITSVSFIVRNMQTNIHKREHASGYSLRSYIHAYKREQHDLCGSMLPFAQRILT